MIFMLGFFLSVACLNSVYADGITGVVEPRIDCQTQVIKGKSQRICATYTETYPTSVPVSDGSVIVDGPRIFDYQFWKGLAPKTDTRTLSDAQLNKHLLGYTVKVQWEDGACQVDLDGTECNSCKLCSESMDDPAKTTLKADCSNIENGRRVSQCEPAYIFFPLKASKRFNGGIGKKV
ncbi:hypothetical protein MPSEU_000110800 [Mayamaea pseudoterrestris]|nr:hypothetical protein MPSEU_000110800 [Mayamaea pseudoterrestris]